MKKRLDLMTDRKGGRPAAPAVVRLSRIVGVDRSALPAASPARDRRRTDSAFLVTQLGQQERQPQPVNRHRQLKMPQFSSYPRHDSG